MKTILFLGGLFPKNLQEDIISNSKYNIQFAADTLQKAFIQGLVHYFPKFNIINLPFVGAFPTRYRKLFVPSSKIENLGESLGFFNLIGIKNYFIYRNAKKAISKWSKDNSGDKVIIIYSIQLPYLKAAIAVKKKDASIKICQIVPDLPQHMGGPKSYLHSLYNGLMIKSLNNNYKFIDYFVFLTKYMADHFGVSGNKWTVIEGIYNDKLEVSASREVGGKKTVLYTGTIAERYGILNLISAFKIIPDDNYQLLICGDGDTKDIIINESIQDPRIVFKGVLKREEILKLQQEATLLVNPRNADGEFTKYSFPSKTMEYLASGTPTLIYKLPGIPDEYYEHCYTVENADVAELSKKIYDICELGADELNRTGKNAKQFILDKKNPIAQCYNIYHLLNS